MPLIEVYARWRDENDKPQQEFITSVSSPAEGMRGKHMEVWLKQAVDVAGKVEESKRRVDERAAKTER